MAELKILKDYVLMKGELYRQFKCGGPFLCFGLDYSCYTMTYDSGVGESVLA